MSDSLDAVNFNTIGRLNVRADAVAVV